MIFPTGLKYFYGYEFALRTFTENQWSVDLISME